MEDSCQEVILLRKIISYPHRKHKASEPANKQEQHRKLKRRVIGGATAAGVGISLLLTGMFGTPEELVQHNEQAFARPQNPVVMMVDAEEPDTEEEEENTNQEEEEEKGFLAKMRKWILRLPIAVRALAGVPLWCLGWALLQGLSILWQGISVPLLGTILKWAAAAVLLIAVYAATMKSIFPHMPLRKILRPKNISFLLGGVLILAAMDHLLPLVWKEYGVVRSWILFCGGLALLAAVGIFFYRRHRKKGGGKEVDSEEPDFYETADVYILPEGEKLVFPVKQV